MNQEAPPVTLHRTELEQFLVDELRAQTVLHRAACMVTWALPLFSAFSGGGACRACKGAPQDADAAASPWPYTSEKAD